MQKLKLKVIKTSVRGEPSWCVRVPALDGKRKRRFFDSKQDAETFLQLKKAELSNFGTRGVNLSETDRGDYLAAVDRLRPFGLSVLEAVDMLLPTLKARDKSCTTTALVAELLKAKASDGASPRYLKDLRTRLGIFAAEFPEDMVSAFTTARLDDWLRGLPHSPTTRNNYRRLLGVLFSFAVERGYAIANPITKASEAKVIGKKPGILTVEQAIRLLGKAEPEILPAIALGLFAGLRPESECWRLDWSSIDFEDRLIDVAADKTKTAQSRFVKMSDNLVAWLLPYRQLSGPVCPTGDKYNYMLQRSREAARITSWPSDCLRHSFASYHYAHFQNAGATAQELGHTGLKTLFKHYRNRVKPQLAERYWNIFPVTEAETEDKVVSMAA